MQVEGSVFYKLVRSILYDFNDINVFYLANLDVWCLLFYFILNYK
jgi:hypothetical protein